MRAAVAFLRPRVQSDDLVIITAACLRIPFAYYAGNIEWHVAPYPFTPKAEPRFVDPATVVADLEALCRGRRRAWLVGGRTFHSDPRGLIPGHLQHWGRLASRSSWPGLTVSLYERRAQR
jgi:hypothetical protein